MLNRRHRCIFRRLYLLINDIKILKLEILINLSCNQLLYIRIKKSDFYITT